MQSGESAPKQPWYADRWFAAVGAGLAAIALLAVLCRHAGIGWEIGCVAGLLAAGGSLALCAFPVRPREAVPPAPMSLEWHRILGFAVLGLGVAHAGVLILVDHTVIEYVMPTMPLYQVAGMLALLFLALLGLTSSRNLRRRLWRSHRGFQAVHVILSIATIALVTVHVVATDRYTHGWLAIGTYCATSVAALAMLLRQRKGARAQISSRNVVGRAAFGRHSTLVVATTILACVGVSLTLWRGVGVVMRTSPLHRSQRLPLTFPHEKHRDVNCLECHHNFSDRTGHSACISCHRRSDDSIKVAIESRFHGFCFECHRDSGRPFTKHGPVAGCQVCHRDGSSTACGN